MSRVGLLCGAVLRWYSVVRCIGALIVRAVGLLRAELWVWRGRLPLGRLRLSSILQVLRGGLSGGLLGAAAVPGAAR